MLARVAKNQLEVKVSKSSHPKLSMSQSLSKPLKYVTLVKSILLTGFNSS